MVGPAFKVGGEVPWQREIVVTHDYITEKLGFDIPADDMRAAFESLELTVTREEATETGAWSCVDRYHPELARRPRSSDRSGRGGVAALRHGENSRRGRAFAGPGRRTMIPSCASIGA